MYNAVFYNGSHGNCNQILNASVVPEITTVHLFNYFTLHPPADPTLFNRHFTFFYSVTWPLNGSEAGGDLVLIQTSLLLLCKLLELF